MSIPPSLEECSPAEIRLRLAGLADPDDVLPSGFAEEQKRKAIEFVACLPMVFGETLDRLSLWDRIGTALQTAYAKTAGDDYEFFVSRVLEHLRAEPSQVARNTKIQFLLTWLQECPPEARQAWLLYMHTHLYAVLVHAKAEWEIIKQDLQKDKKEGSDHADHI